MAPAEKQRIVSILNRKYGTTLPVEVMEAAVKAGFTSWETLLKETTE